jgi:hypothetical protein
MTRKLLKSELPVHLPSKDVWRELEHRLDDPNLTKHGLPLREAPESVWENIERNLEDKSQRERTRYWFKIASSIALLFAIPIVILLIREEHQQVRHTLVIAQTHEAHFDANEASAYNILSEFYETNNTENTAVSQLLQELKAMEQDKKLITDQLHKNETPQLRQLLIEIEMDMAQLVREISNKMR